MSGPLSDVLRELANAPHESNAPHEVKRLARYDLHASQSATYLGTLELDMRQWNAQAIAHFLDVLRRHGINAERARTEDHARD